MKFFVIFGLIVKFIFAQDFITELEYAKMLYQNPRGIGCNKCHGDKGQGALIAKFKAYNKKTKKYEPRELKAPQINDIEFAKFKKALSGSPGMMPSYFLTTGETKILYDYLQTFKKDKK